ncbi:MAG: hypothetical protein WKF75_16635, partial [Singulisphaera sp.]
ICVVTNRVSEIGRYYRISHEADIEAVRSSRTVLNQFGDHLEAGLSLIPDEEIDLSEPRRINVPMYGIKFYHQMFTYRQQLALCTFSRLVIQAGDELRRERKIDMAMAVQSCLALAVDRLADRCSSLCRWDSTPTASGIINTFSRQAIPFMWDFAEGNPLEGKSGGWQPTLEWISLVIEYGFDTELKTHVAQASATAHPLPDDSAHAVITDPPYYYSVPYSNLSDFFYVWLRRNVGNLHPPLFGSTLTPKDQECVQNLPHSAVADIQKTRQYYEKSMILALSEARRIARPDAVGTIVFAHSETEAWETLLSALIASGWHVTASWPIDTEMGSRVLSQRQSTLASSVHLVCRPREHPDGSVRTDEIGDWRDVLQELPRRIHEWMPRLAEEGVVGADAIFACLGPALEVFSRYSRVEKANGDKVSLKDYLVEVWAAVSNEALSLIFKEADSGGLEPDARLIAMWLWTVSSTGTDAGIGVPSEVDAEEDPIEDDEEISGKVTKGDGFVLEFDAARKIAQGLGAHLEDLLSVVEVRGKTARLIAVSERAKYLFGKGAGGTVAAPNKSRSRSGFLKGMEDVSSPAKASASGDDIGRSEARATVLDRVHQAMILFGTGRAEALMTFLVEDGAGTDPRFWKLAQSFSALLILRAQRRNAGWTASSPARRGWDSDGKSHHEDHHHRGPRRCLRRGSDDRPRSSPATSGWREPSTGTARGSSRRTRPRRSRAWTGPTSCSPWPTRRSTPSR